MREEDCGCDNGWRDEGRLSGNRIGQRREKWGRRNGIRIGVGYSCEIR